jgi:hypothetical protein
MLGADRLDGIHLLGAGAASPVHDFGEDVGSHVAAVLGPFVVLLRQYGAGEADDGVAAGEDADDTVPPAQSPDSAVFETSQGAPYIVTSVLTAALAATEPPARMPVHWRTNSARMVMTLSRDAIPSGL